MFEKISNKLDNKRFFAVYTDYESDHNGDYTFFFGVEVSSFENNDPDLIARTIPASKYAKFTTPSGKMPDIIINAWQDIWKMSSSDFDGDRSFIADFEIYDENSLDMNNAVVDIFIGIKE